jgi:hypothetical protein
MTTETNPMQDLSICCVERIELTNERVLGITRECLGSPYTTGTILVGQKNVTYY